MVTVVFVDIVDYSRTMLAQQMELKQRLNAIVARALEATAASERITLDTGDGAGICFLGDPEDALITATHLRAAAAGATLPLRLGINLGPVSIVNDVNGQPNVVGDGINDAQRVMGFANPNQTLVSRSFYEVLSRLSLEYSGLFSYVGVQHDKHAREHEMYELASEQSAAETGAAARTPGTAVVGTESAPPPLPPASATPAPSAAAPTARFELAVLARLETALALCIGPLARLVVRKASGTAVDLPQLVRTVSASVPDPQLPEFMKRIGDLAQIAPMPEQPSSSEAPALRRELLAPELLIEATEQLAAHLGPLARVMVKRAAEQATGVQDLYEKLAQFIDDPERREQFIVASTKRSSG